MKRFFIILLTAALPAMSGCGQWFNGSGSVQIWAAPESAVLLPHTLADLENDVYSHTTRTIRLEAAVNEVVSFQLAFKGKSGVPSVAAVAIPDLVQQNHRIRSNTNVRLYREARLTVEDYPTWFLRLTPDLRELREYPDVLIPLSAPRGALPMSVVVGRCEAIWADIAVPPGTEPGIYRSGVDIRLQGGRLEQLDLVLTVHSFSLPRTQHLPVIAGVDSARVVKHHVEVAGRPYAPKRLALDDPEYPKAVRAVDETIRLLHEHRCSAMLTDLQPLRQLDSAGQLALDWTDYDRLVTTILDGTAFDDRIPALAWPMPVDDREPSAALYGGWGSSAYGKMLIEYLRECAAHFRQRGWFDRHFVWIPLPASSAGASGYSRFAWLAGTIRQADRDLSMVCDLPPQPMKAFGAADDRYQDVSPLVSIWATPAWAADADSLSAARLTGKRTWLQPDRPPYSGSLSYIAPAVHARSLAWEAYRFKCGALFLPRVTDWPDVGSVSEAASPNVLLWPGKPYGLDRPVPSIRLKRILRGVQDYEYLWLLERNQRPAVAELMAEDLFPFGGTGCYSEHMLDSRPNGWVRDPAAWTLARSIMAREITAAMEMVDRPPSTSPASPRNDSTDFAHQLDWRRHVEKVRRVHSLVDGVRIRLDTKQPEHPVVIRATVSTFNATRKAYSGTLSAMDLPAGWEAGTATTPIEGLDPTRTTYREVEVLTASIPTNVDGFMSLKLRAVSDSGEANEVSARVCVLTAQRLARPVVLDGRLDEWPMATNNAAGDFILVGALDVPKMGRLSPDRPSLATNVFVGHDDSDLYIAFNCQDDQLAQRLVTRSNQVRYDDLWPADEDVVEIVLDPGGQAVVPADLLHIAVKANGAVITERGAPCLAAIGGHGDWPGGVTAAVDDRSQPGRWMVEIRVPLASLGKTSPIWGINFARYVARLGEYASWSGTRRYLYSPSSLGNIQLGR